MDFHDVIGASCLLLVSSFLAWKGGFYAIPKPESSSLPQVSLYKSLLFFLFFFLSFLCAALLVECIFAALAAYTGASNLSRELMSWRMPLTSFLALLTFLYLSFAFDPATLHRLLAKNVRAFILGVLSFVICWPVLLFLGTILSPLMEWLGVPFVDQNVVQALKDVSSLPMPFFFNALSVAIAAPLMEEILFRGVLYGYLRSHLGGTMAACLSALWFALFHYSPEYGWHNVELMVYLFVLACYLAFLYERERSLWAPIGLHACVNLANVLLIYFS